VRLQAGMACIGGLREALGIVLVDGCAWTMLFIAIPQRSSLLVLERSEVVKSCLYHRFNPFDRTPLRFVRVV
jgi:hypothetical protein